MLQERPHSDVQQRTPLHSLAVLMGSFACSSQFFKPVSGRRRRICKTNKEITSPCTVALDGECSWNPGVVVPKLNYGLLSETDCAVCNIVMFCAAVVRAVDIDFNTSDWPTSPTMRALFLLHKISPVCTWYRLCSWALLNEKTLTDKSAMNSVTGVSERVILCS